MFLRCGQSNNLGLKMEQILNKYTSTSNDRRFGVKTLYNEKYIFCFTLHYLTITIIIILTWGQNNNFLIIK
ncbi:TPA: hypothetical protein DF272_00180 [Candidatus Falkowbacteria bacterium]|nr:hypothetical protein [Candidatus Falkowbacteria bacterium]